MEWAIGTLIVLLAIWASSLLHRLDLALHRLSRADAIIERCRMTIHNSAYLTPAEQMEVLNGIEAYQEDVS